MSYLNREDDDTMQRTMELIEDYSSDEDDTGLHQWQNTRFTPQHTANVSYNVSPMPRGDPQSVVRMDNSHLQPQHLPQRALPPAASPRLRGVPSFFQSNKRPSNQSAPRYSSHPYQSHREPSPSPHNHPLAAAYPSFPRDNAPSQQNAFSPPSESHEKVLRAQGTHFPSLHHSHMPNQWTNNQYPTTRERESLARTPYHPPTQTYTSDVKDEGPSHVNPVQITDTANLKSVQIIDSGFRTAFPFKFFNKMQSECLDRVYYSDGNTCVAAPTSSGKTVLFKLAMVRVWESNPAGKCVYIAPTKSLCQQKVREFSSVFQKTRKRVLVKEVTGDTQEARVSDMLKADLIVTTPEKFDSVTRSWSTSHNTGQLVRAIRLVCIDEVHLLNETRGHCLEALVSRLKSIAASTSTLMRVVAVSATIPNLDDIGDWLGCSPEHRFQFGEEYRPVPLETLVVGYPIGNNQNMFVFQRNLSHHLFELIAEHSDNKPTLVFTSTRKEAVSDIDTILKEAATRRFSFVSDAMSQSILNTAAGQIQNASLKRQLKLGCAHHSAGLSYSDRSMVEDLFLQGHIKVLCSTSTLALGVNLPARLVIVKGTQAYNQGDGYREYDMLSILQMLGRSGRPQFDTMGRAVIMTTQEQKPVYESLVQNQLEIESSFQSQIISHLNSEILCNSITDMSEAITWIESTFYYIRINKNPLHYGLESIHDVSEYIRTQIMQHLKELEEFGLIEIDADYGQLSSTPLGEAMSKFYISFSTMKELSSMTRDMNFQDLLQLLCRASEFEEYTFRRGEKKILNELNKDKQVIVHKIKGRVTKIHQKILLMIQAAFADYKFDTSRDLSNQMTAILRIAPRVARCMKACAQYYDNFECLKHCITLEKCLKHCLWPDSNLLSKQLRGVGKVFSQKLASSGYTSIDSLSRANPLTLDGILGRKRIGFDIVKQAAAIPRFDIDFSIDEKASDDTSESISVKVQRVHDGKDASNNQNTGTGSSPAGKKRKSTNFDQQFCILVGNMSGKLIHFRRFNGESVKRFTKSCFKVQREEKANHRLQILVLSEMYLGVEFCTRITVPSIQAPPFTAPRKKSSPSRKKQSSSQPSATKISRTTASMSALDLVREKAKHLPKTPQLAKRKRQPPSSPSADISLPAQKRVRDSPNEPPVFSFQGNYKISSYSPRHKRHVQNPQPSSVSTPPVLHDSPPQERKEATKEHSKHPFSFPNAHSVASRDGYTNASTVHTPAETRSPQEKKVQELNDSLQSDLFTEMEWCDNLLKQVSEEMGRLRDE